MARPGTLSSFSDGLISLRRHIILLNEAFHAAAGCILLSFAVGLLKKGVATTCINIRLSDGLYLTIHDFGVPWNCVSHHGRSLAGVVLLHQQSARGDLRGQTGLWPEYSSLVDSQTTMECQG